MIKNIRHIGIVVNNLNKALSFYRDTLGLKIKADMIEKGEFIDKIINLKGVNVRTVKMLANDGCLIELLSYGSHPRKHKDRDICDIGISHLALTVDNLDNEYEKLKKAGIKFNSAPQISPNGKARVAFCCDPEGNSIELVEELS